MNAFVSDDKETSFLDSSAPHRLPAMVRRPTTTPTGLQVPKLRSTTRFLCHVGSNGCVRVFVPSTLLGPPYFASSLSRSSGKQRRSGEVLRQSSDVADVQLQVSVEISVERNLGHEIALREIPEIDQDAC